jgi:OOP family OmpA-OmpF porin
MSAKCDAILITGHTDRIGASKYNQRLSERRATAARNYLVEKKGIDPALISVAGVGENELVTSVDDCKGKRKKALIACFAPDRRVVITGTVRKPAN